MKPVQGLVIGVIFVLVITGIPSLFVVPAMATVAYLVADVLIPYLFQHKDLVVPAYTPEFWRRMLSLYSVFFVAGAVVLALRKLFAGLRS